MSKLSVPLVRAEQEPQWNTNFSVKIFPRAFPHSPDSQPSGKLFGAEGPLSGWHGG